MPTCGSPKLFAAYRVLHRQSVPWHPPCALIRLIFAVPSAAPKTIRTASGTRVLILLFVSARCSASLSLRFSPAGRINFVFLTFSCVVFKVRLKVFRSFKTIQSFRSVNNQFSFSAFRRFFCAPCAPSSFSSFALKDASTLGLRRTSVHQFSLERR